MDRIFQYWFAPPLPNPIWFQKDLAVDEHIRLEFGALFDNPSTSQWTSSPRGLLCAIVLFDQFSRNAFRDTARMFAYDGQALALARTARPELYELYEAFFLLLPFEHSENIADQDHCLSQMQELVNRADAVERDVAKNWLEFARRHREIILRFGRFPHRNAILQRPSTSEELAFLKLPGSRF